jgi:hypothetical protein
MSESSKKKNQAVISQKNPLFNSQKNNEKNIFSGTGKGAFSGIKTKNQHLAEFERMKDGFAKKKGIF